MTTTTSTAANIYNQLGGHQFEVMTGAKRFVLAENYLRFNIGKNGSRANLVKVILNADDTYTMQFWKMGKDVNPYTIMKKYADKGLSEEDFKETVKKAIEKATKNSEPKLLKEYNGLYNDQLQTSFTEYTKLYTSLF